MENEFVLVVDRIEGELAVCLDDSEKIFRLEKNALSGLGEGDCFLARENGDGICFVRSMPEETARRKNDADAMLAALFAKSKGKG